MSVSFLSFAASSGGELKFAIETEPVGLDPHLVTAFASHRVLENIYEGLLTYDKNMELIPAVAESYEIPDSYTIIFTIRNGIKFHDGSPLTVEDVVFSFERIRDPNLRCPAASYYSEVEYIKILDENRVEFKLKIPMVTTLLFNFAGVNSAIVSKAFVESGTNMQLKTNGTGPFFLKQFSAGDHITISKNMDYYQKGLPYLDTVNFIVIPEEISRVSALRNGDVDMAVVSDSLSLKMLDTRQFNIFRKPALSYYLIGINSERKPLDDPRIRRAISYALKREEIIKMAAFGEGAVTGPMSDDVKTWVVPAKEFDLNNYNPEMAKELLSQAGYPDGFEFEIVTSARYSFDKIAQVVQAQLAQVGIKANINLVEWGIFISKWGSVDFDSFISLNGGSTDPDRQLYRTFYSSGSTNKFNFKNPIADYLLDLGRKTVDQEQRVMIYDILQRVVMEESPVIFLYCPNKLFGAAKEVTGFVPMSNESYIYLKETGKE